MKVWAKLKSVVAWVVAGASVIAVFVCTVVRGRRRAKVVREVRRDAREIEANQAQAVERQVERVEKDEQTRERLRELGRQRDEEIPRSPFCDFRGPDGMPPQGCE